jgi:penicillin amidase
LTFELVDSMQRLIAVMLLSLAVHGFQERASELRERAEAALAQTSGELTVAGLEQPVHVIRDRWGVPHIYAKTVHDLFFAQGFVAAQDRLWQLDLWRRTAEGKLAEILGPSAVNRDTFARLLKYRGDLTAEWRSYRADTPAIVDAFVAGINAQIAIVKASPEKLPIEFQLAGFAPEPWSAGVVGSRMAGYIMTRNASGEVQRARLAKRVGVGRVNEFMPTEPPAEITVPAGLDLDDITNDVLSIAAGAGAAVDFSGGGGRGRRGGGDASSLFERPRAPASGLPTATDLRDEYSTIGSNDWVVAGSRTVTGKPLLANDPHRPVVLPSLRYTVHLNAPGWNVIGAGEPALPGIAAGHNDRVAFGFTIVGTDQQDLYVEQLDPQNPDRYLYKGSYEPMDVVHERLQVRGEPEPRTITLRFTRHGPVVHVDAVRHRAYALRWVGSEPGSAGYLKSLALNTAQNWNDFKRAVDGWKVPSENIVYADVDGNIGWIAAGLAPIRPNWNGLLPVPGHEGKYEWAGFLRVDQLPQVFNPKSGFIATANHNILPVNYPHAISYDFGSASRFTRILEVLSVDRSRFTVRDFERLQNDEVSPVARILCSALKQALAEAPITDPARAKTAAMLTEWDVTMRADSANAFLYQMWVPRLTAALSEAVLAPVDRAAGERLGTDRILDLMSSLTDLSLAENIWVDGSRRPIVRSGVGADRARLVSALTGPALDQAWTDAVSRQGADGSKWSWGASHHAGFEHPLATTPERRDVLSIADVPRGGDGNTPKATGTGARQTSGASYREVIDLSDWDKSTTINVPGASGQPTSPHYADLFALWARDEYHPMLFSRAAVEKNAESTLTLKPAARGTTSRGEKRPPASFPPAANRPPASFSRLTAGPAQTRDNPLTLPPGATRVVNFVKSGLKVAMCAEVSGESAPRSGAEADRPQTYVFVDDGKRISKIVVAPGGCDPAWSPDGARLAIVSPEGLWVFTDNGSKGSRIADAAGPQPPAGQRTEFARVRFTKPQWSPDAALIALLATNGGASWVEVVNASSGDRVFKSEPDVSAFSWTADSKGLNIGGRVVPIARQDEHQHQRE